MALNCESGKRVTKADSQAPPPEIRVQVDTEGSGTHGASSQAGIYGGCRHPVVPQLTLNMTVSQAPGSQMEWGIPEGNRRETGAPKGPGLVAAVCTSPAVNRTAWLGALAHLPWHQQGSCKKKIQTLLGDAPYENWSPCFPCLDALTLKFAEI